MGESEIDKLKDQINRLEKASVVLQGMSEADVRAVVLRALYSYRTLTEPENVIERSSIANAILLFENW